ncbi:MAG: YabP/YqfC family sporulation protein [Lachnospiraceae bacterium]|nr:YabP/YqfC family sporulation protein [Lachnospiraceae bacterium]
MRGKEKIVRALQLPEDYQKGRALVRMEGRERVCVENFKGICSCTADEISLTAEGELIHIIGKRLQIDCYTKEEIEISGLIETVTYLS